MSNTDRIIMHLDMDAFFAAVEEREKPRLKGRPIVVGADPEDGKGRGVVSTANYAARGYCIHSAQPVSIAWHLAEAARKQGRPEAVFIVPRHRKYAQTSHHIMEIISHHVDALEAASIDEAYADITSSKTYSRAKILVRTIQKEVLLKEKLSCSVGIGPNKLIAKIASGFKKPRGLTVVEPFMMQRFLDPMPVETLPGIGKKSLPIIRAMGVRTIRDLRYISESVLVRKFGKWGTEMFSRARGEGSDKIESEHEAKSIGEQVTLREDSRNPKVLIPELFLLCKSVKESTQKEKFKFHTVVITVRFSDFTTVTRAHTFDSARKQKKQSSKTQLSLFDSLAPSKAVKVLKQPKDIIEYEAMKLFLPFLDTRENPKKKTIRLVGIRVE